jgi:hypothetical protein
MQQFWGTLKIIFLFICFFCFSFAKIYTVRDEHVIYKKCCTNYWISFVYVCVHMHIIGWGELKLCTHDTFQTWMRLA